MVEEGFVKNPAYAASSSLRFATISQKAACSGTITAPLYDLIEQRAPLLEFLNYPEKYPFLF
jgi:hypothetical protein